MLAYPANIVKEDDTFLVTFPDLENVVTFGATIEEAIQNAEDALNGCLASDFERNFSIPEPSIITGEDIHTITVAGRCITSRNRLQAEHCLSGLSSP